MKQSIIALVGISGVGKSTLLKSLAPDVRFQHLQASVLIKQAKEEACEANVSIDHLRHANIDDNQVLLVLGFKRAADPAALLVVLDGHTIIDTPSGLVRIEPDVFKKVGVQHFVFLAAAPSIIHSRRTKDTTRNRPNRSADELAEHQRQALLSSFDAAQELNIPITVVTADHLDVVKNTFERAVDCSCDN